QAGPSAASPDRQCLAQQGQGQAAHLAGLLQHGHAGLHQHVLLGHLGRLGSEVGVHDAAHGGVGVVRHVRQVVDGVVQAVDVRTHGATSGADCGQDGVQSTDFGGGVALGGQVTKGGEVDVTQSGLNVNFHGLGVRGADLQGDSTGSQQAIGGVQQLVVGTVAGVGHDIGQFSGQLLVFGVQSSTLGVVGVGAVGGLDGQVLHAQH